MESSLPFDSMEMPFPNLLDDLELSMQNPSFQDLSNPMSHVSDLELSNCLNMYSLPNSGQKKLSQESVPSDAAAPKIDTEKVEKRGRKKIYETDEQRKAVRMQSNRRSAKDNRERKRLYVEELEAQVRLLTNEVIYYKTRLSKYEFLDHQRNLCGYEISFTHMKTREKLCKEGTLQADEKTYSNQIFKESLSLAQERCKAMEQLARAMVEISLPMPCRFLYWALEKNIDILDETKLSAETKLNIGDGNSKLLADALKYIMKDLKRFKTGKAVIIQGVNRMRSIVKSIVKLQKDAQIEYIKLENFMSENYVKNMTPFTGQVLSEFAPLLKYVQEMSDSTIYQLKDTDFTCTNDIADLDSEQAVSNNN